MGSLVCRAVRGGLRISSGARVAICDIASDLPVHGIWSVVGAGTDATGRWKLQLLYIEHDIKLQNEKALSH